MFSWLPIEATLSIFKVRFLLKIIFWEGFMKAKEIAINAES
jgi:hypothetical protein